MQGWKTLEENAYSIQYPPEWELDKNGQMNTHFVLFSPLVSHQDHFSENINLIIQDLSGLSIDLERYTEISEEQIKTLIDNSIILKNDRIKNNSEEYQRVLFTGDQGNFHLIFEQHYYVWDNKAYVLTFTCEESNYKDYQDIGERILNSFVIKKSGVPI
jgi:serine/threonine-protein kinase